jgi:predicted phosphodiesterase
MITRRDFLASSAGVAMPGLTRGAARPLLRIGLVADAQYADAEPSLNRYYRKSIDRLGEAIEHFNGKRLDFCVHVGDLIDHGWENFEAILHPFKKSEHRFYQLLGNHDFEVDDLWKSRVAWRLGMERRYSWFDQAGFRFVILDTTEVSTYAQVSGTSEHAFGVAALEKYRAEKRPQAEPWNSGIGSDQLAWLDAVCREAGAVGLGVVILAHHPVLPEGGFNVWNHEEVLEVIARHRHVLGWINGHHHAGGFVERDGVFYLTLSGMVDTEESNAYAVARVYSDRIELVGHGREPSRELLFRA